MVVRLGVVDSAQTPNDFAAVNQGQLKMIATRAAAEMDAHLPLGAGGSTGAVHLLVDPWGSPTASSNDFAPVNLGMLKTVARPFYDQLLRAGYITTLPSFFNSSADNYAAANVGQVKNLFSFDLLAVTATNDLDGDGIPDWWEKYYFPATYGTGSFDPNATAANGTGLTILQSFQQGLNPNDFFNGQRPVLTAASGDAQLGPKGGFVPAPLVVAVTNPYQKPVVGAPVTFTVGQGGGQLQSSYSGAPGSAVTVLTDDNGQARVFFKLPDIASNSSTILPTVTSGTETLSTPQPFTETSDDGSGTYPSPFAPSFVTGYRNPDGSEALTWQNNTDDQTPVIIYQLQADGTWAVVATLPPGSTTYTFAAGLVPALGSAVGAPGTSATPTYHPIPTQSYATVDLGGINGENPVSQVAIDDQNNVAFMGSVLTLQGENLVVNTWQNGTVSNPPTQTLPMHQVLATAPDGTQTNYKDIGPEVYLRANGDVLGDYSVVKLKPNYDGGGVLTGYENDGGYGCGFLAHASTPQELLIPDPPYDTTDPKFYSSFLMRGISPIGYMATVAGGGYLIAVNSASGLQTTVFDSSLSASSGSGGTGIKVVNQIIGLNPGDPLSSSGWAVSGTQVWNGSSIVTLPGSGTSTTGFGTAINDSNDIVISDSYDVGVEAGHGAGLMNGGTTFVPFLAGGSTAGLIPSQFQNQVRNIFPFLLSNRRTPQGTGVEPILHIVFYAQVLRTDGTNTSWGRGTFLLRKLSNGSTDLSEIPTPEIEDNHLTTVINAAGVIATIDQFSPAATNHALLLVPVHLLVEQSKSDFVVDGQQNDFTILEGPSTHIVAGVLPINGVTFKTDILQDAQVDLAIVYNDKSATSVHTVDKKGAYGYMADFGPNYGGIFPDNLDKPYQSVDTYDMPSLGILYPPRLFVASMRYTGNFIDYMTISVNGGPPQTVAETKWSMDETVNFSKDPNIPLPVMGKPALVLSPGVGETNYTQPLVDSPVSDRTTTTNGRIRLKSNWQPDGSALDLAHTYPNGTP